MRNDTRLSGILHVLLHLAQTERPMTSDTLANYMNTNAVVVRRTMSGLRDAGLVRSEKGHGGGWTLARKLSEITLADVYAALGAPTLFAIGNRNDNPDCLVEKAVNSALGETLREAEAMVAARLANISLADIAADFAGRISQHRTHSEQGKCHA
jgi:Rrf2 family protein